MSRFSNSLLPELYSRYEPVFGYDLAAALVDFGATHGDRRCKFVAELHGYLTHFIPRLAFLAATAPDYTFYGDGPSNDELYSWIHDGEAFRREFCDGDSWCLDSEKFDDMEGFSSVLSFDWYWMGGLDDFMQWVDEVCR